MNGHVHSILVELTPQVCCQQRGGGPFTPPRRFAPLYSIILIAKVAISKFKYGKKIRFEYYI